MSEKRNPWPARVLPDPIPHKSGYQPNPPEVVWQHYAVNEATGCWEWTRSLDRYGYGQITVYGKATRAHTIACLLAHGPIAEGMVINHLCAVRHCINPAHLELLSVADSNREMVSRRSVALTCKHGHNDWRTRPNGRRSCKECDRIQHRKAKP